MRRLAEVRWIRWVFGVLLVGLILATEIEEGHGIHIFLILVSVASLAGVAFFYQERPRLSVVFAAVGLLCFLFIASVHLFGALWDQRWLGWMSLVVAGLICVFLARRFTRRLRRP